MSKQPFRPALALLAVALAACTAPSGMAPSPAVVTSPGAATSPAAATSPGAAPSAGPSAAASPFPFPSASFIPPTSSLGASALRLDDLRALIRVPLTAKGQPQPTFTRAEAEAHFDAHDVDNDGEIAKEEWERLHEPEDAPQEALDADGDGAIQEAEFHAYVLQEVAGGDAGGAVEAFTDAGLPAAVGGAGLTVVHFYATWCGPCRLVAPALATLATANPGVRFGKLDVDANPAAPQQYAITSIPMVLYFKGGQVVGRTVGMAPRSVYQVKIDALK